MNLHNAVFQHVECHACGKKGHIRKVCRSKAATESKRLKGYKTVHSIKERSLPSPGEPQEYSLYPVSGPAVSPLQTTVSIEN